MRFAAIIVSGKVDRIVDVALFQLTNKQPVTMVNIERYDVQVGDDYHDGKFWRDGIEVPRNPTLAELQAELQAMKAGDGKTYVRKLLILQRLAAVGKAEAALSALKADELQYEMWSAATEIDYDDPAVRGLIADVGADPDEILKPEEVQ